jgi:hypothetical protein
MCVCVYVTSKHFFVSTNHFIMCWALCLPQCLTLFVTRVCDWCIVHLLWNFVYETTTVWFIACCSQNKARARQKSSGLIKFHRKHVSHLTQTAVVSCSLNIPAVQVEISPFCSRIVFVVCCHCRTVLVNVICILFQNELQSLLITFGLMLTTMRLCFLEGRNRI